MPLTPASDLPNFAAFSIDDAKQNIEQLLAQARAAQQAAYAEKPTWEAFYWPLEAAIESLSKQWGLLSHLNAVADSPQLREVYEDLLGPVTQFYTELALDESLFKQYKALSIEQTTKSDPLRFRIVENTLRDFRLGGAELVGAQRERFAQIQERAAQLAQQFSKNVLDATNAFTEHVTDSAVLAGLPQDVVDAAALEAKNKNLSGWLLTFRMPCYLPIQQYADNRSLRERFYRAYVTRASDQGPNQLNNLPVIDEILALRLEQAQLLGFENYAQLSLATKMANDSAQVNQFLEQLAARAKPHAQADLKQLAVFAGMSDLQPWDIPYYSEKLKEQRYSFSELEVKNYFQAPRVLDGLFKLVKKLFGAQIRVDPTHNADKGGSWDPSVMVCSVTLAERVIGHFYVDLYARSNKRGGAWMDAYRGRKAHQQITQTPIAYLVCNFMAPAHRQPGLLTHDEVITLFHEMGHGLHHLLTQVDELAVAGINGVEWDAVELPSQFMENFCWDYEVVKQLSAHIQTQEPLPRPLFEKMQRAKNFQSGLQTVRQLEFGLFDMALHSASSKVDVTDTINHVRQKVAVIAPPSYNRFEAGFSHIFAGGYAAGYYSYKWAEVLSADCYAAFEEPTVAFEKMGQRFLQEILSRGGSRPAIASFEAFRGRAPDLEALLRHTGLKEEPSDETTSA
jgi:oligopeptidase A